MKKSITIMILLIGIANNGLAQRQQTTDSLKHELAIAKQDTSRVLIMARLCALYRWSNTDSALFYGDRALTLAQQIKFPAGELYALATKSWALHTMGNLSKSLELGFRALQIGQDNQLGLQTGRALLAVGKCYLSLKDYPKALSYFRQYEQDLLDRYEYTAGLAYCELNIGAVFLATNQLDSASIYLKQADKRFQQLNYFEPEATTKLGDLELKKENLALALEYYLESAKRSREENELRIRSQTLNKISTVYKMLSQRDSSIIYAEQALAEAELLFQKVTIKEAANQLAELYEPVDTQEALRYYKIAIAAKDSVYGVANIQAFETIANQQQERQKEIKAAKIAYQNQMKQYAFLAGLVALLLVAFFLYRNNRQKQQANSVLESTLTNLKSTQSQLIHSEKMASLGELTAGIAHEIQNPLNFVNNFSEVNKELIDELKEAQVKGHKDEIDAITKDILENEDKIMHHDKRAEAIVKSMLQHSRTSTGEKEPTDINALADEYLRLAYHGFRAKDKSFNAQYDKDFDPKLPSIKVVSQDIGRVILNLVTIAFHAVSKKREQAVKTYQPTVIIQTRDLKKSIEVIVKDNGSGIPNAIKDKIFQPFFTTKATGEGTGLGLSMSYDIITKGHSGQLTVESKEGEGSTFTILLPKT